MLYKRGCLIKAAFFFKVSMYNGILTPKDDLMTKNIQRKYSSVFLLLLLVCTQNAFAYQSGVFPKGDKPGAIVFFSLTIIGMFTALAVHELGHVLTGLAQGFRFELFVVGLLGIKRTDKGIILYLNKNLGMMGGVAATIPIQKSTANRKKFAYMILGGPVTSLLYGLLSIFIYTVSSLGAARGFWLVTGAVSIAVLLATTLPRKTGIFFTDRVRFMRLLSKGKAGIIEEALLSLMAQYSIDQSCKNINLASARLLKTDDEPMMIFWSYYYEYQYYKDNLLEQEAAQAKEELMKVKSTVSAQIWKMLKIDEAVVVA